MKNDKGSEELIASCKTVALGNAIRQLLVMETQFYWFYVYNNGDITATNAFGGKLPSGAHDSLIKRCDELITLLAPAPLVDESLADTVNVESVDDYEGETTATAV